MSAEPIDDGGTAFPFGFSAGQSYRADVAKLCLAALAGREDLDHCTPETLADVAVTLSDALIARLKGGPR